MAEIDTRPLPPGGGFRETLDMQQMGRIALQRESVVRRIVENGEQVAAE